MRKKEIKGAITERISPTDVFDSEYGTVTGKEWLGYEQKRLLTLGRKTKILNSPSRKGRLILVDTK